MSNGAFQAGTWVSLPSNCTHSYRVTFYRCASWGMQLILKCVSWAEQETVQCISWAWQQVEKCSWWSWFFCVLFAIVTTLVCLASGLVVSIVCTAVGFVEIVVCLVWSLISIVFCLSRANGGTAFVLTDGSIMMQEFIGADLYYLGIGLVGWGTNRWWKLTPDASGSYANGSWSQLANSHVARTFYASGVLADGRVVVCGGEYSEDSLGMVEEDDNNTCEIYDPVANTWTTIPTPMTPAPNPVPWKQIGDAPCAVLPNGSFLLGSGNDANIAVLDPASLTWTAMKPRKGGFSSDEDSWVLMPDNTVVGPSCQHAPYTTTWVYRIATDSWEQGNDLPHGVVDVAEKEIGPGLLLYDGTAFFIGANQHTAIYNPATSAWTNGPDLPNQMSGGQSVTLGIEDGPAALLVNGNVLFSAGAPSSDPAGNTWSSPCWFFEYDGSSFQRTNDPPNNFTYTYTTRLLLLPNGDILYCQSSDSSFYAYHSDAAVPEDSYRPVIQSCPSSIQAGTTIQISGMQFNGLSQAVGYGDDSMTATNYPLVRIVNKQTNHVQYCRTHDHTTIGGNGNPRPSMGVATGAAVITTSVDIPIGIDSGDAMLFVVANGIPSQPFPVTVTTGLF
ncbi:MAG: kelch repeat-containing protein [Acidobacteriaceae bacterium]